jgi:hypothetical protein
MEAEQVQTPADYVGRVWRLPDGQLVLIEIAENDLVAGRRIEGDHANTIVVCKASELRPK